MLVGAAAVAAVPAGVALARYTEVTLVQSGGSAGVGALLGLYAILLARRGRERVQITLGRAGGAVAARAGQLLGILGLWLAATAALSLAFFGLLTLFAS